MTVFPDVSNGQRISKIRQLLSMRLNDANPSSNFISITVLKKLFHELLYFAGIKNHKLKMDFWYIFHFEVEGFSCKPDS